MRFFCFVSHCLVLFLFIVTKRNIKISRLTLYNNFVFIRTCRPYLEVLPGGICKDYMSNQLISQDDKAAANIDIHIRRAEDVLKQSFIDREPVARFELLQELNKFITSRFFS